MASNWNYTVTHYDSTDNWDSTDITDDVVAIPTFTSVGSGEMNSAKLILSADQGHFIKVTGGAHPKIRQFDRIRILVTDGITPFTYNKVFDVMKITPIKTKTQGTRVQLLLLGIEHWLDKVNYAKTSYFETAFNVFKDIGQSYNAHKGTLMPTLKGHDVTSYLGTETNKLPDFTSNIYDYGLNEDTCYSRMNDVIDKLGASADDGGVLDFFEMAFLSSTTSVTEIIVQVRRSGSNPLSPVTIEDSANVNVGESEGGIEAITGTVINAWGANDSGSLPTEFSRYRSRQQRFSKTGSSLFPEFKDGELYLAGSIVQKAGLVFTTASTTGLPPPLAPWTVLTPGQYYGNIITYSPWTDEAVPAWQVSGAHPHGATNFIEGKTMWDANVVIRDNAKNEPPVFGTWADLLSNTDSYSTRWKYDNISPGIYRGTRCLITGTGIGAFTGNDAHGKPFANSVAEFDGKRWLVKYSPVENMLCAIMDESKLMKFIDGSWYDITFSPNGSHCFHYYDSIGSAESASLNQDTNEEWTSANNGSAVKVVYSWNPTTVTIQEALNLKTDPNFYSAGAWLNFRFPFPPNTRINMNGLKLGELYGGAYQIDGVPDSHMEPATLDIQNMHLTHDGFRGFNKGTSSEDLGQISSIDFMMKLEYFIKSGDFNLDPYTANFKMRCYLFDIDDNVVFQDFVIFFNKEWQAVSLPVSGFQIYRGRKPLTLPFLLQTIILPKGLDAQEIFEWRHVKQICFQTQESYDDHGRYSPVSGGKYAGMANWTTFIPIFLLQLELSIDAFRFVKPLLVNTGAVTDRQIEPTFLQKQEIGSYEQLKSDAFAELEKAKFQRVQYDVTTTGRFDIGFGDAFFLKDSEIVTDFSPAQPGESTSIVRLVNKKSEYSITKPVEGKGGFIRVLNGVRRFI